jgi:hypothetical protein
MLRVVFSAVLMTVGLNPLIGHSESAQNSIVPVVLRPDTDHGTCSFGFQVNAGGALLRSGPAISYPVIAKLKAGHIVAGCDGADGWEGVIVGTDETCSVGIMVTSAQPYEGPCRSGWIEQIHLTSIYG